jgi:hypothetical protein
MTGSVISLHASRIAVVPIETEDQRQGAVRTEGQNPAFLG